MRCKAIHRTDSTHGKLSKGNSCNNIDQISPVVCKTQLASWVSRCSYTKEKSYQVQRPSKNGPVTPCEVTDQIFPRKQLTGKKTSCSISVLFQLLVNISYLSSAKSRMAYHGVKYLAPLFSKEAKRSTRKSTI